MNYDLNITDFSAIYILNKANIVLSSSNNLNVQTYDIVDNILVPAENCRNHDNDNDLTEIENITENKLTDHSTDVIQTIQEVNNVQVNKISSDINNSAYNIDSDNDDAIKDPDYYYNDSESSEDETNVTTHASLTKSDNSAKNSLETSCNISGQEICNNTALYVENSKSQGAGKKNFCYYCKTLQSKIGRHLETVHKNEEEVKNLSYYQKVWKVKIIPSTAIVNYIMIILFDKIWPFCNMSELKWSFGIIFCFRYKAKIKN